MEPGVNRTRDWAPELPWFAAYTRYQHEKGVAEVLASKGFETFLPLYAVTHRWKDRFKNLSLPLFPCYVFFRGSLARRIEILTTPGLHWLVGCGGCPSEIPRAEVEALQRAMGEGVKVEPYPFLKYGDWVRVKSGPLTGIEGILVRKKNRSRLVLSIELLQKSATVEVDGFAVERVGGERTALGVRSLPNEFLGEGRKSLRC